ncbi:hypothetical protein T12_11206 [Trichinella patagoniensis]|uniref:Uncharacterized protein n=1 Tax=Trichinella patagoniensis TaxID=990121 RepID=A0A0V0ZY10_9BILA|nr:hypothetical protein T12_11206 [Trichinella patagoniensis]
MQAQWPNSRRIIGLSATLGNLLNFVASHPHIRWEYWTADTSNNDHQLDSFTLLRCCCCIRGHFKLINFCTELLLVDGARLFTLTLAT